MQRKSECNFEYLVCSAVHLDNGRNCGNPHGPRNIKTGIVFVGLRHCNCYDLIHTWSSILLHSSVIKREPSSIVEGPSTESVTGVKTRFEIENCFGKHHAIEGFISNKNNFYNREDAKRIALEAGQITSTIASVLTSEDLW